MTLPDYLPVLVQLILAVSLTIGIIVLSHIFGQRGSRNTIKDSPYECGLLPQGKSHPRFSVKFYVTAILFILFDIEIIFLFPWVLIYREFLTAGIPILTPVLFFLTVLIIGLLYEMKKGALEWEK